ncbi:hypothetical protein [Cryobacterium sp. N22]|uniref:hypothetical protein n=1 Tax=Cryobacterium sp. N22 TaxID=2048290 RepID=UPI000CE5164A|nr:hypothetical protein [Cryobacterium sp. N22]
MGLFVAILLTVIGIVGALSLVFHNRRVFHSPIAGIASSAALFACLAAASWAGPFPDFVKAWTITAAIAAAALAGGPVVSFVFHYALRSDPLPAGDALPATAWIGVAERLGFIVALQLGFSDVAAILLGVKALGQYVSTTNHVPAARVLGTLVSITWALLCFAVVAIGYPVPK